MFTFAFRPLRSQPSRIIATYDDGSTDETSVEGKSMEDFEPILKGYVEKGAKIRDTFYANHKTPTGEQKEYWRSLAFAEPIEELKTPLLTALVVAGVVRGPSDPVWKAMSY